MRIVLACVFGVVIGCQCDMPQADLMPDAAMMDQSVAEDAASVCVKCDPIAGGACTPSRCAKSGDGYCCVF